ncbi:MAG: PhnD/SsuA/transferrin family substrate-binding protein [Candidatus Sumerlaeia bacterium]
MLIIMNRPLGPYRLVLFATVCLLALALSGNALAQFLPNGSTEKNDNAPTTRSLDRPPRPENNADQTPPETSYLPFQGTPAQSLPDNSQGPEIRGRLFRIGYLTPAAESTLDQKWFMEMRRALIQDAAFTQAMQQEGITGIALRPCDHPEDMLERMLQEEFDLVFCPAMVYGRAWLARKRLEQQPAYNVVFQTKRRETDTADMRRGGGPRHRGVLFVRRDYRLDINPSQPDPAKIRELIAENPLAVSGSYDTVGFFYIRKFLWEEYNRLEPESFLFCGTPQEAVKTVVSGLAPVGACEESVLKEVIASIPGKPELSEIVTILETTKPAPTDPVVMHERYDPTTRRSLLGRAAAEAVREYYNQNPTESDAPRLVPGTARAYQPLVEDLEQTGDYGW